VIITIVIAFISLIILIILHELGHFLLAKKFGVRVDEFGVGYPPRIWGKKIGETIYSINFLPFGAFVKIFGEDEITSDSRSFSSKPIWQKSLIIVGGVVSFWLVGAILLSIVFSIGTPHVIDDNVSGLSDAKVQIVGVGVDSPAEQAGLKIGDHIKQFSILNDQFSIDKVSQIQVLTEQHNGQEVVLTIQRGKKLFDVELIPRAKPPAGEGAMGVALVRTTIKSYPWYKAPIKGVEATGLLTFSVLEGLYGIVKSLILGQGMPAGAQVVGPIGIFSLFAQVGQLGVNYFLQFIAMISVYLAIFNLLPIPALDGGKLLFLIIEAVRGKPVNQKIEQKITAFFFSLLILLMIWVTIKDVIRLF